MGLGLVLGMGLGLEFDMGPMVDRIAIPCCMAQQLRHFRQIANCQ